LAKIMFGDPCRRAIAARQWKAVPDVMLQARGDVISARDIVAFETADERRPHHTREIRIFAKRFPKSWPCLVASDIEHWRKTPCNSCRASFHRRDLGGTTHQDRIPRRSHPDLLRKKRRALDVIRAMDRIDAVDHWDLQTRSRRGLLDRPDDPVPMIERDRLIVDVQDRTYAVFDNRLLKLRVVDLYVLIVAACDHVDRQLRHLSDLFFDRHPPKQSFDLSRGVRPKRSSRNFAKDRVAVDNIGLSERRRHQR